MVIPPFSSEPSRPRRLGMKKLPEDLRAVVDLMLARLCELKKDGLKPIIVYNCWLGRSLSPLKKRSHLMCDYIGENDSTRSDLSRRSRSARWTSPFSLSARSSGYCRR